MLVHDIIKIKYVNLGYIKKNYPYHLISDEEMFNAFIEVDKNFKSNLIDTRVRFFDMNYPDPFNDDDYYIKVRTNPDGTQQETRIKLKDVYADLKTGIQNHLKLYLRTQDTQYPHSVPNWIYTYMLGEVVYNKSDYLDIEDTLELLGCDNIDNVFTKEACTECYRISSNYITSADVNDFNSYIQLDGVTSRVRPLTVFGEPHVIKSLRMEN